MRRRRYRWEWRLRSSPEALWPLLADTNRFNRDVGLSGVEADAPEAGRRRVRLGRLLEWEEEPFEWERPRRFSVRRRFLRGPLAELRVTAELIPDNGGTYFVYELDAEPRNVLGRVAIPLQKRRFDEVVRRYDQEASRSRETASRASSGLARGGKERLQARSAVLLAQGSDPELVRRLAETVERGDELELVRLRPYRLAAAWGADRRAVLELCLGATRAGLLDLHWDVLCPLCRGGESRSHLGEIDPNVHCASCGIDFRADFERSVEVTFRPNPSLRDVEVAEYCVGGPRVTPHVVAQQILAPREARTLTLPLEPGAYRLRLGTTPVGTVNVDAETAQITFANDRDEPAVAVLERAVWADDAATAAEVTALQVFRDLFAEEVVHPDEPVSVGSLAVLFTDLRGSTRYYREVGDAPAFASVRDHLTVLREAVAAENGALVKTMGDAIMAVFRRPVGAVRTIDRAREELRGRPLVLKAGVHYGPCIAVNQDGRLDYFGSTVNAAARLAGLSQGELVLSEAVRTDPEVAALLDGRRVEPFAAELKGFDDDRFQLWRC